MANVPQAVLERMRKTVERVKQGQFSSYPRWDLGGKNKIVDPGKTVAVRLLPRWDYAEKYMKSADGKVVENPDYVDDVIYGEARVHWYSRAKDGQQLSAICRKSFSLKAECPLCDAVDALNDSADEADQKLAKKMRPQDMFFYNAVVGSTGQRRLDENGLVAIRVLSLTGSQYAQVMDIMSGGSGEDAELAACGDVSDPREGYDIIFQRPPDKTERWKLTAARKPSRLFIPEDSAAFKGWTKRLLNIPELLQNDVRTFEQLYTDLHGEAPPESVTSAADEDDDTSSVSAADEDDDTSSSVDEDLSTDDDTPPIGAAAPSDDDDMYGFDMPDDGPPKAVTSSKPSSKPVTSGKPTAKRLPPKKR